VKDTYLPSIQPKVTYDINGRPVVLKHPQRKFVFDESTGVESPEKFLKNIKSKKQSPPKFYLNRDLIHHAPEHMKEYSFPSNRSKPGLQKKKIGLGYLVTLNQVHNSYTSASESNSSRNHHQHTRSNHIRRPVPMSKQIMGHRGRRSISRRGSLSSKKRSNSATDHSIVSTASSQENKRRLGELNSKSKVSLPPLNKHKLLSQHMMIPSKLSASPYVVKFNEHHEPSEASKKMTKDLLHTLHKSPVSKFFKDLSTKQKKAFFAKQHEPQ